MASQSDNFNRSNADLNSSSASGGGTWVEFINSQWVVESNQAHADHGSNHTDSVARLDGVDLDGDDHEVEATLASFNNPTASYYNVGLIARKEDNSTNTFYRWTARIVNTDYDLAKHVAGSYTSLGTAGTPSASDVMRLKCDGTTITGFVDDSSTVSQTDSTISGSQYIQCGLIQDDGNATSGTVYFDDWSAQDLVAAEGRTTYNTDPYGLGIASGVSRTVKVGAG